MAEIVCGNWRGSETEISRVKDRDGSGCAQVVLPIVGVLLLAVGLFLPLELSARIGCGLLGFTLVVTAISVRSLNTRWRVCLDREKARCDLPGTRAKGSTACLLRPAEILCSRSRSAHTVTPETAQLRRA